MKNFLTKGLIPQPRWDMTVSYDCRFVGADGKKYVRRVRDLPKRNKRVCRSCLRHNMDRLWSVA